MDEKYALRSLRGEYKDQHKQPIRAEGPVRADINSLQSKGFSIVITSLGAQNSAKFVSTYKTSVALGNEVLDVAQAGFMAVSYSDK